MLTSHCDIVRAILLIIDNLGFGPEKGWGCGLQGRARPDGGFVDSAHRTRNSRRSCPWAAELLPLGVAAGHRPHRAPEPSKLSGRVWSPKERDSPRAGHCAACHTRPGGQPFAGGYGLNTPFGTIYSTNITPDPDTGIGRWSLEAFARAMHEGVARDGSHLFPAFPYDAFTKLSDDDVKALYAYLMTRPPVRSTAPANTIPFPLNIRALSGRLENSVLQERTLPSRSVQERTSGIAERIWPRGSAIVAGCHTPRNAARRRESHDAYAGAVIDGWIAPALTEANPSPVPWTQDDLFGYLRTGYEPAAWGCHRRPMTPVIRDARLFRPCRTPMFAPSPSISADIDHASAHETASSRP